MKEDNVLQVYYEEKRVVNVFQITAQYICRNLGQRGVAAGTHVGCADHHGVEAVII